MIAYSGTVVCPFRDTLRDVPQSAEQTPQCLKAAANKVRLIIVEPLSYGLSALDNVP